MKKEKSCGKQEGKKDKQKEIARKMKIKKYSIEEIKEITGLTEEEINSI